MHCELSRASVNRHVQKQTYSQTSPLVALGTLDATSIKQWQRQLKEGLLTQLAKSSHFETQTYQPWCFVRDVIIIIIHCVLACLVVHEPWESTVSVSEFQFKVCNDLKSCYWLNLGFLAFGVDKWYIRISVWHHGCPDPTFLFVLFHSFQLMVQKKSINSIKCHFWQRPWWLVLMMLMHFSTQPPSCHSFTVVAQDKGIAVEDEDVYVDIARHFLSEVDVIWEQSLSSHSQVKPYGVNSCWHYFICFMFCIFLVLIAYCLHVQNT